jgi:hypothetical protein
MAPRDGPHRQENSENCEHIHRTGDLLVSGQWTSRDLRFLSISAQLVDRHRRVCGQGSAPSEAKNRTDCASRGVVGARPRRRMPWPWRTTRRRAASRSARVTCCGWTGPTPLTSASRLSPLTRLLALTPTRRAGDARGPSARWAAGSRLLRTHTASLRRRRSAGAAGTRARGKRHEDQRWLH